MKVDAQIRVVKTENTTEVFVHSEDPYINFKINLPADAPIKTGDGLEFAQAKEQAAVKE